MSANWREVEIESARLVLKPFSSGDADAAFSCITHSLTRFMGWEPSASRHDFDRVWQSWMPSIDEGSDFVFAIRRCCDRHFLGLAGLHHAQTASPELGIWIREDRHRQGFGREAVASVAQWASQTMKPAHYIYPVAEENHASRRIAELLGGVVIERRATPKYMSVIYRIPSCSVSPLIRG